MLLSTVWHSIFLKILISLQISKDNLLLNAFLKKYIFNCNVLFQAPDSLHAAVLLNFCLVLLRVTNPISAWVMPTEEVRGFGSCLCGPVHIQRGQMVHTEHVLPLIREQASANSHPYCNQN